MTTDERYMALALNLAKKAEGRTCPNPLVGAIVVKNDRVIGKGYHKRCGLAHAEINALGQAGRDARSATLYVTLEPCDHFGRTPPCTDAIIRSGIKRVIMAMNDPNPINNGRGLAGLRKAGIRAECGILEEEAIALNKPYIKFITRNIPYITVKIAQSLDGKIATRAGESRWITSKDARLFVHKLRGTVDAVMVGANTVIKDDPLLLSEPCVQKQPMRVIVDSRLRLGPDAKVLSSIHKSPVIIATTNNAPRKRIRLYESKGADVLPLKAKKGNVDLAYLVRSLGKMNVMHLLVEGGGELIASLLEEGLVDRILCFVAPKIIGGRNAVTSVEGKGITRMKDAIGLKKLKVIRFEKDILIEAEVDD